MRYESLPPLAVRVIHGTSSSERVQICLLTPHTASSVGLARQGPTLLQPWEHSTLKYWARKRMKGQVGKYAEDYTAMCKETPRAYAAPRITQHNTTTQQEALHLLPEKNWARTTPHFLPASDKLGSDIIPPTERGSDRCCVEIFLRAQTMGSDSWWVRQSGLGQPISSLKTQGGEFSPR